METYNTINVAIRAHFFGRKVYGLVQGTSGIFSATVAFFMPIYFGSIYDSHGSYTNAIALIIGIAIAGVIITLILKPPKLPAAVIEKPI